MTAKPKFFRASLAPLYGKIARGEVNGFTVPAFNLRTLVFESARAVFRAAKKVKASVFIFELARSEITYTAQSPNDYATAVLAAAVKEKWQGPIFLQGDHFKIKKENYQENKEQEIEDLKNLIKEAIDAGFYNIDIDCSALDLQENIEKTNQFIEFIKKNQPQGVVVNIGGEVGEIGGENTSVAGLIEFLQGVKGIGKVAVQTGTSHGKGGQIDWGLLENLSQTAKRFGLAGIVQHGASTLPKIEFNKFPVAGVCEIHLATELMDIVLQSRYFPRDLKEKIKTKQDLGKYKQDIDTISSAAVKKIMKELEKEFIFFFNEFKLSGTASRRGGLHKLFY